MAEETMKTSGSLTDLTQMMLKEKLPMTEDVWEALKQMGYEQTCGAAVVFGLIQKGIKGDVNAAKLLRDMNGEGAEADDPLETGFSGMTDAELVRIVRGIDIA